MQSVGGNTLALGHRSLEAECEKAAERPSREQGNLGYKVRFKFEISTFALKPKSDRHPSDIMRTLFRKPVHWTIEVS